MQKTLKKKKKRLLCPNNVRTVPTLTRLPRGRAARSTECEHLFPLGRSKLFRDVVLRQLQLTQPHTHTEEVLPQAVVIDPPQRRTQRQDEKMAKMDIDDRWKMVRVRGGNGSGNGGRCPEYQREQ